MIQIADKIIPAGYKRIVGLTAILIALIAKQQHWISDDNGDLIILLAGAITGVGVVADKRRKDQAIKQLKEKAAGQSGGEVESKQ